MSCPVDLTFGPVASNCRGGFDFTIEFEDIMLSLVPSWFFIVLATVRLWRLYWRDSVSGGCGLRNAKLILAVVYSTLQLSILIMGVHLNNGTRLSTIARSVSFVQSAFILPLTVLEDRRSEKPSFLLNLYLLFTILFDIVRVRTTWLIAVEFDQIVFARLHAASVAVKFVLFVLESQRKAMPVGRSPEETAGPLGLATLFWLNSLFSKGYTKILSPDDLPSLEKNIAAEALLEKLPIQLSSLQFVQSMPRFGLAKTLAYTFLGPLLLGVLPRLALVGFKFCQPLLLNSLLTRIEKFSDKDSSTLNAGYGLIGATIFIYFGVAVSTALYWYTHERFISMTRGALVAVIYEKLTLLWTIDATDSAAVTLMSTDIERIRVGLLNLHEFWGNSVEVALASWLLYTQLGVAFVAPLVVVICSVACSSILNRYAGSRQKKWMERIQIRVAETARMLSNIKQLKISGLANPVEESTQQLRVDELDAASGFRTLYVFNMAFGFAPMALCPVITFAIATRTLDTQIIFTSLAYLVLLAEPLGVLFGEIPYLLTAFTCLERIQNFLSQETQADYRRVEPASLRQDGVGLKHINAPSFSIKNGRIGWTRNDVIFQNISIQIPPSSFTILIGPVGCGKSTLCKALLAEIPFSEGAVNISIAANQFKSAFCNQSPYLYQGSIRDNIIGSSAFNKVRYREAIKATMLDHDFKTFPRGDATIVGSDGVTLSGGQKQRVAIARALYHNAEFYVFDDSLSGLDADTEKQVFNRVFGPKGILQVSRATIVLVTHSIKYLPLAAHIISLGIGGLVDYEGDYAGFEATRVEQQILNLQDRGKSKQEPSQQSVQLRDAVEEDLEEIPSTSGVTTYDSFLSEKDRMAGNSSVYRYYLASIGNLAIIAFTIFGIGWGFFYNFGNIWLGFWASDTSQRHSRGFYVGLYSIWQVGGLASLVLCYWMSYTLLVRISGSKLHQSALRTVVHAPLGFTSATEIGVIANLFSQDMTLIDNELPVAITNLALDVCNALAMAAVIATSSPYLVVLYPFLVAVLYLVQKFYLRTSRQLRLLDLESRSPLYTQFLDTTRGLATIRSFGWTTDIVKAGVKRLDAAQKPAYLLAMVQRWLQFVLQCIVAVLAVVVVVLATQLHSNTAGFTGASVVALMTFGDVLNFIIRWWAQFETSIGAVSRLKSLSDKVPPESFGDEIGDSLQSCWPAHGHIEITNVSASFQNSDATAQLSSALIADNPPHLVLENLSLTIAGGEKVAICGRSGSGKSSLILLLLRMLDPLPACSKNIVIDSISLHSVARDDVRDRIIAMSQDPVFLPGEISIKRQLDPFGLSTEAQCDAVLQLVGLGAFFGGSAGLKAKLQADSLSGGQKQLFNLARTILRGRAHLRGLDPESHNYKTDKKGGILLLDEISSSVDLETERTIKRIIMEEFEKYTIIMVAHRLDMVMEFDTVLVMDHGRIVEQGNPKNLVKKEDSYFSQLYMAGERH